jgi:hypothetical protein
VRANRAPVRSILFGASSFSAQMRPLELVSTAWPPFTNATRQPRFALDSVEEALRRVTLTANTTIVSAPDFTTALLSASSTAVPPAWKDAERERTLIFSQPYLENRLVLVGRHGADVSAKSLPISRVSVWQSSKATRTATPYTSPDRRSFVSHSEEDSLKRLLSGDVDYTLMDDLVVQYILSNYPKESEARLQIGSEPLCGVSCTSRYGERAATPSRSSPASTISFAVWWPTARIIACCTWTGYGPTSPATESQKTFRSVIGLVRGTDARLLAVVSAGQARAVDKARVLSRRHHLRGLGKRSGEL